MMASRATGARPAMSLLGILLSVLLQSQAVKAAAATLFLGNSDLQPGIENIDTIISVNIPPGDSNDINFYVAAPIHFQYVAFGFGNTMADSLMMVMYPSANNRLMVISPRMGTDYIEPEYNSSIRFTSYSSSVGKNGMIVNGTCFNCRTWARGSVDTNSTAQSMLWALGPNMDLSSDDPNAGIRRHIGAGRATMDLVAATGPGGVPLPELKTSNALSRGGYFGGSTSGFRRESPSTEHGIVFVIATLVVAPMDFFVAGALRRWPIIHSISATVYVGMVIGGFVSGVLISNIQFATRRFQSGHQILGLLAVALLFAMFLWGIAMAVVRQGLKKRGEDPSKHDGILSKIHRWTGRLIWVMLVVNGGLGLRLAERNHLFMMGYGVLVGGLLVIGLPIWFLVWRCSKHQRVKQTDHEDNEKDLMQQQQRSLYDHDH